MEHLRFQTIGSLKFIIQMTVSIFIIPDQRMPFRCQVSTDLVGFSRDQMYLQKSRSPGCFQRPVLGFDGGGAGDLWIGLHALNCHTVGLAVRETVPFTRQR